jgi:hypothetical protein
LGSGQNEVNPVIVIRNWESPRLAMNTYGGSSPNAPTSSSAASARTVRLDGGVSTWLGEAERTLERRRSSQLQGNLQFCFIVSG